MVSFRADVENVFAGSTRVVPHDVVTDPEFLAQIDRPGLCVIRVGEHVFTRTSSPACEQEHNAQEE